MTDSTVGSTAVTGGSTTEQVKDQVKEKAQVAQERARGAMGQARGRLSEQVDQRSTQAGERIAGTASTSDPAYTGSDYGTETPFTQADVVPPVAGTYDPAAQAVTPVTTPADDRSGTYRDPDPLP